MKSRTSSPASARTMAPPAALTIGHGLVAIATSFNKAREEVGLTGAVIIGYLVVFWAFGTKAQKAEFTDKVLLLRGLPETMAGWLALSIGFLALMSLWMARKHHTSTEAVLKEKVGSLEVQLTALREKFLSAGEAQNLPFEVEP